MMFHQPIVLAGALGTVQLVACIATWGQVSNHSTSPKSDALVQGDEIGGVRVYYRMNFDDSEGGFTADNGARCRLDADAVHGRALHVECPRTWSAIQVPVGIAGSRGLKMAMLMKGRRLPFVGVNVADAVAGDNTTSYAYRYLGDDAWTPILYYLDRFRYNSRNTGYVSPQTVYRSVRFYGPTQPEPGTAFAIDDWVIYRGEDRDPPKKPVGLKAQGGRGGVELGWDPAGDNVGVQAYVIARAAADGPFRKIAESPTTRLTDTTASRGRWRYRVFAVDFEENYGPWSDPVEVTSISQARPRRSTREQDDRQAYAEHVREVHDRGRGKVRRNHATLFGDSLTAATVYPQCAASAFGTLRVEASGHPRMRTSFGRERIEEILDNENPEFLFLLFGTNNNKRESSIPAAMEDLAATVRACERRGTVAFVGTIPPRGWTPDSAPEANFNRHVIALCRQRQIPCGHIFEAFQAAGPENRRTYLGGDGVHWRGAGMKLAAQAWARALNQVRFVIRDQP